VENLTPARLFRQESATVGFLAPFKRALTNATVDMIAEKAADMIKADHGRLG